MELDFSTRRQRQIRYSQSKNIEEFIFYITRFSDHEVILAAESLMSGMPTLKLLNLVTNEAKNLGQGSSPTYVAEHKALFFYVTDKPYGPIENMALFVVEIGSLEKARAICQIPKVDSVLSGMFARPVVQISADVVVFCGRGKALTEYDCITSKVTETNLKDLYPLGWREKSGEVICIDQHQRSLYLVKWTNKIVRRVESIEADDYTIGWTYIEEIDALIFGDERLRDEFIYYYDFRESAVKKLGTAAKIRSNGAYFPAGSIW